MVINCESCGNNVTKERFPGIKCGKCEKVLHIKCAKISSDLLEGLRNGTTAWLCPKCRSTSRKTCFDVEDPPVTVEIHDDLSIKNVIVILKEIQQQLSALETSHNFLCSSFDQLKDKVCELTNENKLLKSKIDQLEQICERHDVKMNLIEAQMDRPNQLQDMQSIVICGLPSSTLNAPEINKTVLGVINKVGATISTDDIVSCRIWNHSDKSKSIFKDSCIVSLKTTEIKDDILMKFRGKKSLQLNELDVATSTEYINRRIYIMQHFTKFQFQLYSAAKCFKEEHHFKYLWCKNNNIYLRKSSEDKIHHIFCINDIHHLQRMHQTA